jgi:hypothetical protein
LPANIASITAGENLNMDELLSLLGKVHIDMNGNACKVPYAPEYIKKVKDKGIIGKKKKMARCFE